MNTNPAAQATAGTLEGRISTTPKGLGFVKDIEKGEDVRIEAGFLNTALHGDIVRVSLHAKVPDMQQTGEVTEIVARARTKFVGTVAEEANGRFIVPDEKKMYVNILLPDANPEATPDMKVYVEMYPWTDPAKNPTGKVIEVIGHKGTNEAEIRSIILENNIDDSFPAPVVKEAEAIHNDKSANMLADAGDRVDFRDVLTFTIDPVDAKDFDDALSFKDLGDGTYQIGVHIADVSHYVTPGSELDTEAKKRAYSVYLVDRTIPMLPEVLSNDLCSLKPDVDRLTFSAWWTMNDNGDVLKEEFGKTIIHSAKRLTYEDAQKAIEDSSLPLHKELNIFNNMAKKMRDRRSVAGSIDFEQNEVKFELDEDGVPLSVYTKERLDTHKLIEEFMLLANFSVAEHIRNTYGGKGQRHTFIYRIHDHPNREKLADLAVYVKATGHELNLSNKGDVTGAELNRLFKEIAGTPEENLIKTTALRSMAKAAYATLNIGHFGLAAPAYTHFTSPIRRYADLIVHRLLQEAITTGKLPNDQFAAFSSIAEAISAREVDTVGAERDSIKYKQAEYMSARIGEEFDAVVSGVSEWGLFIEERTSRAEGLIRIRNLGSDYFELEPKKYRLVGKATKKTYSLGDIVKVKVVGVDLDRKMIDYALVA
jgi:ribonuclease R